jgi:hypothetical protein
MQGKNILCVFLLFRILRKLIIGPLFVFHVTIAFGGDLAHWASPIVGNYRVKAA